MKKNILKKTLIQEGISQARLAKESSINPGTINKICNHRAPCSLTMEHLIANTLNKMVAVGIGDKKYSVEEIFQTEFGCNQN